MSTTHTLGAVPLPRGMVWIDEHDWVPVEKSTEYSTTGALLIDAGVRQAGRPITLQATEEAGWLGLSRARLAELRAMASVPGASYTLTLADGRQFTVQFADGDPISAEPLGRPELPGPAHPYIATVRLMEV